MCGGAGGDTEHFPVTTLGRGGLRVLICEMGLRAFAFSVSQELSKGDFENRCGGPPF